MVINKLFSSLLGIKKSKFRITDRELENIANNTTKENIIDVDATHKFDTIAAEENSFKKLLDAIFKEAREKYENNSLGYWDPKYASLDSYKLLSEQGAAFKRDFAYFLLNEIVSSNKKTPFKQYDNTYLREILEILLKSNLDFTENDFIHFMNFWVNHPTYITIGFLTAKLRKKVKKNGISEEFHSYLKMFLKSPRFTNKWYSYYETSIDTIQRILHTYTMDNNPNRPSFVLISDPYADYINKFIKNTDQKEQEAYCQIFKIFETNKEFYNPFKLLAPVEEHIDNIGTDVYKNQVIDFIKKASEFKPKMLHLRVEKITYNSGKEVRYNCQYIKKENITILRSMILSIATYNDKKSAIPYLIKITKRSFSNANALRLGETSRSLGKLCIYTLIFQYDQKGKEEIKKLYQETTSKGIKNTISKYSKLNSKNILE